MVYIRIYLLLQGNQWTRYSYTHTQHTSMQAIQQQPNIPIAINFLSKNKQINENPKYVRVSYVCDHVTYALIYACVFV